MPAFHPDADAKSVLPVVMPSRLALRLNQLAAQLGINRSRLIRQAVEQAYFADAAQSAERTSDEKRAK